MPKKKKAIITIAILIVLIVIGYFLYTFIYDDDIDRISKKINIESYNDYFDKYSLKLVSKKFNDCSDNEKIFVIKKASETDDVILKLVACRYLSQNDFLKNNLDVYKNFLYSDNDYIVLEAIYNCKNISKDIANSLLLEYLKKEKIESSKVNFYDDYLGFSVIGYNNDNLNLKISEFIPKQIDFSNNSVYEINLLVPDGFNYFFSFPNFDDNWDKFSDSKIIKKFTKLEAYEDFKKFDLIKDYFSFKKITDENTGIFSEKFTISRLFRDDLKFASYDDGYLIVTFKGKNITLLNTLIQILKNKNIKGYSINEDYFNNIKINILKKTSAKAFYFSEISDYFILSNSFNLIKKSIESFTRDNKKSITFNPLFQKLYDQIDLTGKRNFLFGYSDNHKSKFHKGFIFKSILDVAEEIKLYDNEFEDLKKSFYSKNDKSIELSKFINPETSVYYISNSFDFRKNIINASSDNKYFEELSKKTKLDIEKDLLPIIDNNLLIMFNGIDYPKDSYDNLAISKFALIFTINRKEDIENKFNSLFSELTKQNPNIGYFYNTKIFNYGEQKRYSFCIFRNFLIISNNIDVLKSCLEKFDKNETNSDLNRLRHYNFSVLKISMNEFLNEYLKYLSKYSTSSSLFGDFEVENKIKPLFEVLKQINSIDFISKLNHYYFNADLIIN
ncbi:MAG TPA: hypothetical protein VIR55_11580 [Ignavibacteria bacterium]